MRLARGGALAASLAGLLTLAAALPAGASAPTYSTGGGHVLFAGEIDLGFSFSAVVQPNGAAAGSFHHSFEFDGHQIDYWGSVTCLSVDAANGRAWIGGVLTKVTSTHPDVVELPGDDAWFRVLDSGPGPNADDRSTFMGFQGSAGIDTSEQYCAEMPWPDNNERTHPVVAGNVTVSG
ncbi:MAG: hypothetical protein ACRDHD_03755 [Candidatus Limnocylindria bacterium]